MKKRLIILIVLISLIIVVTAYIAYNESFGSFWTTERSAKLELKDEVQLIKFIIDDEAEYPSKIDLSFKGYLDGTAVLSYGSTNSANYNRDTITGNFKLKHGTDWYADSCFIMYEPINGSNGELKINCKIYSNKK